MCKLRCANSRAQLWLRAKMKLVAPAPFFWCDDEGLICVRNNPLLPCLLFPLKQKKYFVVKQKLSNDEAAPQGDVGKLQKFPLL